MYSESFDSLKLVASVVVIQVGRSTNCQWQIGRVIKICLRTVMLLSVLDDPLFFDVELYCSYHTGSESKSLNKKSEMEVTVNNLKTGVTIPPFKFKFIMVSTYEAHHIKRSLPAGYSRLTYSLELECYFG